MEPSDGGKRVSCLCPILGLPNPEPGAGYDGGQACCAPGLLYSTTDVPASGSACGCWTVVT